METNKERRVWIELEIDANDEENHERARLLTKFLFTKEEQEQGMRISYTPPHKFGSTPHCGCYNGHTGSKMWSRWVDRGCWFYLSELAK